MDWHNKKQRLYICVFGGIALILLWAFISAGIITHDFTRSQLEGKQDKQEALIKGVILTETKDGQKYWEIYGDTGIYNSDNAVANLEHVIGNFYKDNKVSMSFQSSKGSYNTETKVINLYQDTVIALEDGTVLLADELTYPGNDMPIIAKGNVKISRGDEFLATADEVIISSNYENMKIKGNASSKIYKGK